MGIGQLAQVLVGFVAVGWVQPYLLLVALAPVMPAVDAAILEVS